MQQHRRLTNEENTFSTVICLFRPSRSLKILVSRRRILFSAAAAEKNVWFSRISQLAAEIFT